MMVVRTRIEDRIPVLLRKIYMDLKNPASFSLSYRLYTEAKKINSKIPIFSEIFDQDKWLPPKMKLFISLEQNKLAFSLLSKTDAVTDDLYTIEILNCKLYVQILEMDSMVDKEIENILFKGTACSTLYAT